MAEYQDRVERGGVRSQPWEFAYLREVRSSRASDPGYVDSGVPIEADFEYALGVLEIPDALYEVIAVPELISMAPRTYGYQLAGRMLLRVRAGGTTLGDFAGDGFTFIPASGGAQLRTLPVIVQAGGSYITMTGSANFRGQYIQSAGTTYVFAILRRRIHGMGPRVPLIAVNDV
jgi:hypothetical protein